MYTIIFCIFKMSQGEAGFAMTAFVLTLKTSHSSHGIFYGSGLKEMKSIDTEPLVDGKHCFIIFLVLASGTSIVPV